MAAHRRAVGLTQEQLAERAGVNVKTVQGAEQGRTQPGLRTLGRIAKALETSLESLVPRGRAGSVDATVHRIEAELRELPVPMLEHVAAVVHGLAAKRRGQ